MTGVVDNAGRSLLRVRLRHPVTSVESDIDVWIDTVFTSDLVIPLQNIVQMGLPIAQVVRASLADGSEVELDTYACQLDWFGKWLDIEAIANQGLYPLLGVGLMQARELNINFKTQTLTLN